MRLSADLLSALATRLAPGSSVVACRQLSGGLSADTDEVELVDGDGQRRWSVVVRRHKALHHLGLARAEYERLRSLHRVGLPVAEPLLLDEGELFGVPALVLERLPGAPVVDPADPHAWAVAIGETLAAVHDVSLVGFEALPRGVPELTDLWLPPVLQHPRGREAWDRLRAAPPALTTDVLIHGDFQSTNVLWSEGRLTAVLDWTMVSRGPAGVDLGESRIDALLLFGPEIADEMLRAYERARGVTVADMPMWDLRGSMVLGMVVPLSSWAERYAALGRADLTLDILQARLDAWIDRALAD